MWLQTKLHLPSYYSTSISISKLIFPLVLISVIVFCLSSHNLSFTSFPSSWKSFSFFITNSSIEDSLAHHHESSYTGETKGLLGGSPPSQRPFLAFSAGRLHGHMRHLLLGHWKDKDPDVQVYDELPRNVSYESMLRSSKGCLCPSGYEVASPRVVEAIYAECIPILTSKRYVPPFSDVLNWNEFWLVIEVENVVNVRKILKGVSEEKYLRMHERLRQVQRHFVMNGSPKRFDLFHMIVHST